MLEVEWRVNVKSGITQIEYRDLSVKNKKEWDVLSLEEQEKRINAYLKVSESYICVIAVEWNEEN